MAISYLGNIDAQDTFTLGSNHSAVINGQTGTANDIVKITVDQTATVNATADATQTIKFEAGVVITAVQSNILGTKVTFTNTDGTDTIVNANASNTFQIGTATYTAAEFVTFSTNNANYVVTGNEVPAGTLNPAFTITTDATASLTEAVNADVVANASITEVDGASVQGATLEIEFDVNGTAITFDTDVTRYDDNLVIAGNVVGTITSETTQAITMTLADDVTTTEVEALLNAVKRTSSDVGTDDDLTITLTNGSATGTADVAVTTAAATAVAFSDLQGDYQYPTVAQAAVVIDADASINTNASFSDDLANGTLTIALGAGSEATDVLSLPVATGGDIMVVDGNVYYNVGSIAETSADTLVGTITGNATAGSNLVITLNANATEAAIDAILQETTFDANDTTGTDGVRYIDYTLSADGQTATGQAVLAVSSSSITLTTDADGVTGGVQGDTNATFAASGDSVTADGINVFTATAGMLTSEDDFTGGSTEFDKAIITMGNSVAPTIDNVEVFELLDTADTDDLDFAGITNTDGNNMTITLGNAGDAHTTNTSLLNLDGVTSIALGYTTDNTKTTTITTDAAQTVAITAGESLINLTGNTSNYTINAATLDNDVAGVTVSGSSTVTINNVVTNVVASTNTGDVTVNVVDNTVDHDITIVAGSANNDITGVVYGDTITVTAGAIADDKTLTISGEGTLDINTLEGDLDLSGFTGVDVDVAMDNVTDDGATITLGALEDDQGTTATTDDIGGTFTVSASTASDELVIDATAAVTVDTDADGVIEANENATINLSGSANITITGSSADVDASGKAAGTLDVATVANSETTVTTAATAVTLTGAATSTTVVGAALGAALTLGSVTADYAADVTVTGLGTIASSSVDATYLTGDLDVTIVEVQATTVTLGDGVTSATVNITENGGDGRVDIDATDFAGTLILADSTTASATTVIDNLNTTLDAANDLDASGAVAADESFGGILEVTLEDEADVTITAGLGALTVTAGATSADVTIDASAMVDNETLTIVDSTVNVTTTITGVIADVTLAGNAIVASATTVNITTGAVADSATTAITLGTDETVNITADAAVSGGTTGIVTVDADLAVAGDFDDDGATANTNPNITITGDATVQVTDIRNDVDASGATGDVTLTAKAEDAANTLVGGAGDDTIDAGAGNDTVVGGAGADSITGGAGVDTMTGGVAGATSAGGDSTIDTFVFESTAYDDTATNNVFATGYGLGSRDIINDFVLNVDLIDLSSLKNVASADYTAGGAGTAEGTAAVVAFGDLNIAKGPTSTIITIDMNNDGEFNSTAVDMDSGAGTYNVTDIQIELVGDFGGYDITAGSFIFG